LPKRGEREQWRDVRCAEFYGESVDGIESYDIDSQRDGAAAMRDDFDG
jgi:hypothetical protein